MVQRNYSSPDVTLTPLGESRGLLTLRYLGKNERALSLEHGYDFLQQAVEGTIHFPKQYQNSPSLSHIIDTYFEKTGSGNIAQNLALLLMKTHHKVFDRKIFSSKEYEPLTRKELSAIVEASVGEDTTYGFTVADQKDVFLSYDFHRKTLHEAGEAIFAANGRGASYPKVHTLLEAYENVRIFREGIIAANYGMIPFIVRLYSEEFDEEELSGDGAAAAMRAVDAFDCERGYKFSTFLGQSILREVNRVKLDLRKKGMKQVPDYVHDNLEVPQHRSFEETFQAELVGTILSDNLAMLNETEKQVIIQRFGFDGEERTLEQLGKEIGVTRERIRQIQIGALKKLRAEFLETYQYLYE